MVRGATLNYFLLDNQPATQSLSHGPERNSRSTFMQCMVKVHSLVGPMGRHEAHGYGPGHPDS